MCADRKILMVFETESAASSRGDIYFSLVSKNSELLFKSTFVLIFDFAYALTCTSRYVVAVNENNPLKGL